MTSEMQIPAAIAVSLVLTYLLHSTLLLCVAWVVVRGIRSKSFVLSERIWKFAAIAGTVTAPLQVAFGFSNPVVDIALVSAIAPANIPQAIIPEEASIGPTGGSELPVVIEGAGAGEAAVPNRPLTLDSPSHHQEDSPAPTLPDGSLSVLKQGEVLTPRRITTGRGVASGDNELLGDNTNALETASSKRLSATSRFAEEIAELDRRSIVDGVPTVSSPAASSSSPSSVGLSMMALGFAAFVACGLLRIMLQTLLFQRRIAAATRVQDDMACRVLARLIQRSGIRRDIRFLASSHFSEPAAFGLWRWTIVLPVGLQNRLSKEELRALLAHELAHLARGDVRWLWAGRVLCSCLAFQPLNFVARNRWQQAAEYLCDDWAVDRGVCALSLARCLTRIAEWSFESKNRAVALAASGPKRTIVRRVERLVNDTERNDRWALGCRRRLLTAACLATIVLFSMMGPRCGWTATDSQSEPLEASEDHGDSASTINSAPDTDPPDVASLALSQELQRLEVDLQRVDDLLRKSRPEPEIQTLAERLRERADRISIQSHEGVQK